MKSKIKIFSLILKLLIRFENSDYLVLSLFLKHSIVLWCSLLTAKIKGLKFKINQ